jgi:hypothetical protein
MIAVWITAGCLFPATSRQMPVAGFFLSLRAVEPQQITPHTFVRILSYSLFCHVCSLLW